MNEFLARLPIWITRWSRGICVSLVQQLVDAMRFSWQLARDCVRILAEMMREIWSFVVWSFKWMSRLFLQIETGILGMAVDLALIAHSLRYVALLLLIGYVAFIWSIWAFGAFVISLGVAVVRFIGARSEDIRDQERRHVKLRNDMIFWLRWPLRVTTSAVAIWLVFFNSNSMPFHFGSNIFHVRWLGESVPANKMPSKNNRVESTPDAVVSVTIIEPHSLLLKNLCEKNIGVTVHYVSSEDGTWITDGWRTIPASETVDLGIKSYGSYVDIIARTSDGDWVVGIKPDPVGTTIIDFYENGNYPESTQYKGKRILIDESKSADNIAIITLTC